MEKREIKLRVYDALTVYGIALIVAAIVGALGYRLFGIWAIYISYILTLAAVFAVSLKTRLKISGLLKFNIPSGREFLGSGLVYGGALLIAFPLILIVQIIAPNFAITCFHISDAVSGHSPTFLHIILIIIITGISEAMLFEGYVYTRLRPMDNIIKIGLTVAALYALYQLDLYTLFSLLVMGFATVYVRSRSGGMTIPTALHLLNATLAYAVRDFATEKSELVGMRMGALQACGMSMIFAGAAIPVVLLGVGLLGDFKNKPLFLKLILLIAAMILIAAGYALSHI